MLDLGSTTFQLLVTDVERDGSLTPVLRDRVVLNLGLVLAERGEIPGDVATHAAATARRLRDIALRSGAEEVLPIATSALRDSPNRAELEALLADAVGMPVAFIDGREEARLTFAGVRASVALPAGPILLLDLGGGSLEVAAGTERGLDWGVSLPIGAGRLTGLLVRNDPPTKAERKAVRAAVDDAMRSLPVAVAEPDAPVASGGTAGALLRLLAASRWTSPPTSLNQFTVAVDELEELTAELARLPLVDRLRLPGIDERRAEILPAGGWILTSVAKNLGIVELIHSEWGLREGVVLDAIGLDDVPATPPTELRRRSVDRLARGWGEDQRHAGIVARLAVALFDALITHHDLGPRESELLDHAARLHEIGNTISPARFHKHGAYLVENAGLRGFDPDEIRIVACVVRFQRGKDPRGVYIPFADLSDVDRRIATVLTGIFRVAHAASLAGEGASLAVTVRGRGVTIELRGILPSSLVVDEARVASGLLARALEMPVEVAVRESS